MKKLGLICLAVIMALGTMGVGYAMWFDTITINGTVKTGQVKLIWLNDSAETSDPAPGGKDSPWGYLNLPPGMVTLFDHTIIPGQIGTLRHLDKNVGWTDAIITDPHNVQVTLNDVYPCYAVNVSLHALNDGTVPVKIPMPHLTYYDPSLGQNVTGDLPKSTWVYVKGLDQYGETSVSDVIELYWAHDAGEQLEPHDVVEYSFYIHVLQPSRQNYTYNFSISLTGEQWNEYTGP
jgi:hypothetical protein